ncbi:hypothetical protein CkaCkLH20_07900 [Colletotrichum karsti]|uniref:cyclin-dependent kinase n=1 Tax=Colletotrichum karsti TaxID=1095194 RepID=A0A9P6I015_9PEZI|nr:uncharacterized protein CkaCkLH20_07900 [Colletotrichum karsti]KAF9874763.1 hypothetical protein CkaCkLH20_07900 [Colletotrichum karsti]
MADDAPDWRTNLSASERYENIQKLKAVLEAADPSAAATSQSEAFSVENQAYKDSISRAQYDEICQLVGSANLAPQQTTATADESDDGVGVTIGPYRNCLPVANGLTSEVYRCKDRALKVIVETHNIEPHNPHREAKILATLKRPCIPLLETFRDQEQRFVLVFPYKPLTLADVIDKGTFPLPRVRSLFREIFSALKDIHGQGIIHRDVKPEAILLDGPDGPAYLSDFGTAWHPTMSAVSEPVSSKILDIGTGPYRAPDALFGDKAYGPSVDMWAAGAMLAECCRNPPSPLFESRPTHEDGNQLGLILSIFKTLGTPTKETWPEAATFKTPPFEMYRSFEGQPWDAILPDVDPDVRDLVAKLVRFDSKRWTAEQELREEKKRLEAEKKAAKKLKIHYNKFDLVARKPKHTDAQREQALLDQQEAHEASGKKLAGGTALAKMIIPRRPGGVRKRPNRPKKRIGLTYGAVERIYHKYRRHLMHVQRFAETDQMEIDAEGCTDKSPMDIDAEGYANKDPYQWEDAHVEHMTGVESTGMSDGQMERFKADAYKGRKLRQLHEFVSMFKSPVRAQF